jgi:hypothetical protein
MIVYAGTMAEQFNWALSLARQFGGQGTGKQPRPWLASSSAPVCSR